VLQSSAIEIRLETTGRILTYTIQSVLVGKLEGGLGAIISRMMTTVATNKDLGQIIAKTKFIGRKMVL
jgi:hypothetical protein